MANYKTFHKLDIFLSKMRYFCCKEEYDEEWETISFTQETAHKFSISKFDDEGKVKKGLLIYA